MNFGLSAELAIYVDSSSHRSAHVRAPNISCRRGIQRIVLEERGVPTAHVNRRQRHPHHQPGPLPLRAVAAGSATMKLALPGSCDDVRLCRALRSGFRSSLTTVAMLTGRRSCRAAQVRVARLRASRVTFTPPKTSPCSRLRGGWFASVTRSWKGLGVERAGYLRVGFVR